MKLIIVLRLVSNNDHDGLADDSTYMIVIVVDADKALQCSRKALDLANALSRPKSIKRLTKLVVLANNHSRYEAGCEITIAAVLDSVL